MVSPKIVEQGGVQLKHIITRSSPMESDMCENQGCPVCESGKGKRKQCIKSTQGGAGYTIKCRGCSSNNNKTAVYHGETSRTLYSRTTEHAKGHKNRTEGNPLVKHEEQTHNGEQQQYNYEPVRFFRVRINKSLTDPHTTLMNSKSEFRQGEVPRVMIVRGLQHQ